MKKDALKILLLENISASAVAYLKQAGFTNIRQIPKSLDKEELADELKNTHVLGIRSKTRTGAEQIAGAPELLAIGCFGVGTNQVDLDAAAHYGVIVFNAPYSSTRSVAELTIASLVMIARKIPDRNIKMHQGRWDKSAAGAREIRDKVLGLVGYGHIGQQVGLLAEAMGLEVIFYDREKRLPLGRARSVASINEILQGADFVSLHVPARKEGKSLIGQGELSQMKKGSCLLNFSRGSLVDLPALREAVNSKHLAGAALDVFPNEPEANQAPFSCELAGVENILLTPHLGGSTEEAQRSIGLEVSKSFVDYLDHGTSSGAVNFPQVSLSPVPNTSRILNVHRNVPGALSEINGIISSLGVNIEAQYLSTYKEIGYLIMDVNQGISEEVKVKIEKLPISIRTRIIT